jgi:hypothetical protein
MLFLRCRGSHWIELSPALDNLYHEVGRERWRWVTIVGYQFVSKDRIAYSQFKRTGLIDLSYRQGAFSYSIAPAN